MSLEEERSGRPVLIVFIVGTILVFAALYAGIYVTDQARDTTAQPVYSPQDK